MSPRALLLTGTVGVGKSTVAGAVGSLLAERAEAQAVVDLDALRRAWPATVADRFNTEVGLRNLASVAGNYLDAGFTSLVLAGVLETAEDRARSAAAVGVPLTVCRLTAEAGVVAGRLRARHVDDEPVLRWHLDRAGELAAIQQASAVEDVVLDVSALSVRDAADAVLRLWDGVLAT